MADTIPSLQGVIHTAMYGAGSENAPWDVDD